MCLNFVFGVFGTALNMSLLTCPDGKTMTDKVPHTARRVERFPMDLISFTVEIYVRLFDFCADVSFSLCLVVLY